jgi:type II secretory pathway pseudopilin PulG
MMMEVLAALTLFAIAMAGLAPLLVSSTRGIDQGRRTTAAAILARDKIEEISSTDYAVVSTGSDTLTDAANTATYARTWTLGAGPTPDTQIVTVTVGWSDRTSHQVTLQTLITP